VSFDFWIFSIVHYLFFVLTKNVRCTCRLTSMRKRPQRSSGWIGWSKLGTGAAATLRTLRCSWSRGLGRRRRRWKSICTYHLSGSSQASSTPRRVASRHAQARSISVLLSGASIGKEPRDSALSRWDSMLGLKYGVLGMICNPLALRYDPATRPLLSALLVSCRPGLKPIPDKDTISQVPTVERKKNAKYVLDLPPNRRVNLSVHFLIGRTLRCIYT
jgi:hypothetical protein